MIQPLTYSFKCYLKLVNVSNIASTYNAIIFWWSLSIKNTAVGSTVDAEIRKCTLYKYVVSRLLTRQTTNQNVEVKLSMVGSCSIQIKIKCSIQIKISKQSICWQYIPLYWNEPGETVLFTIQKRLNISNDIWFKVKALVNIFISFNSMYYCDTIPRNNVFIH